MRFFPSDSDQPTEVEYRRQQEALLLDDVDDEREDWWDSLSESLGVNALTGVDSARQSNSGTNRANKGSRSRAGVALSGAKLDPPGDGFDGFDADDEHHAASSAANANRMSDSNSDYDGSSIRSGSVLGSGGLWGSMLRAVGWKHTPSEYELVQTFTDSFVVDEDDDDDKDAEEVITFSA